MCAQHDDPSQIDNVAEHARIDEAVRAAYPALDRAFPGVTCYFCHKVRPVEITRPIDFGHRIGIQIVCDICDERRDNDDDDDREF